jgi:hypothetical protein
MKMQFRSPADYQRSLCHPAAHKRFGRIAGTMK